MFKVGLTGGIGSGKTTVARIFQSFGIPVLDSDAFAKELMVKDETLKAQLTKLFGEKTYQGGRLNREWLGQLVFSDPQKLKQLNETVHPIVIQHSEQWANRQKSPYVVKEAALFFESGSYRKMDYMIGVTAPKALRLQRVQERDQVNQAEVLRRMAGQMDEEEKMSRCDGIIINDGQHSLIKQALQFHRLFLKLSQNK